MIYISVFFFYQALTVTSQLGREVAIKIVTSSSYSIKSVSSARFLEVDNGMDCLSWHLLIRFEQHEMETTHFGTNVTNYEIKLIPK